MQGSDTNARCINQPTDQQRGSLASPINVLSANKDKEDDHWKQHLVLVVTAMMTTVLGSKRVLSVQLRFISHYTKFLVDVYWTRTKSKPSSHSHSNIRRVHDAADGASPDDTAAPELLIDYLSLYW